MRPSSSASSSSLTKTPRSPIWPKGLRRSRSPAVVIGTSAISRPGARSSAAPAGEPGGDDRLEVVDVVQVTALELVDRGIEVARDSEVDQEQRPPLAPAQRALDVAAFERPAERAGRGDDDVDRGEL